MQHDTQLVHHLWHLKKSLDKHFLDHKYEDTINKKLDADTCKELEELVNYIKLNY